MPRKTTDTESPIARLRAARSLPADATCLDRETLHCVAHGTVYGFQYPTLPTVPNGAEAKRLREAVGVSADILMRVLDMPASCFQAWEEGGHVPTDSTVIREIGTAGIRRVFGLFAAYIAEQAA